MKIIHFADLHFGIENYGVLNPETGLSSRFEDFCKSLDYLIDFCLNEKNSIDLVIFSGDAYKNRDPSPTYINAFSERMKRLANKLPVVLIVGNHDLPAAFGKANTLDIYSALQVPQMYVSTKPEIINLKIKNEYLQVATLPWMNKNDLVGKNTECTIQELNKIITKKLGELVSDLSSKIDQAMPSILAAHYSVSGALYGSEQEVMVGRDMAINIRDIKNTTFNYVALGHLHKYQVVLKKPLTIYSGSLERIDFGEEKDKKGFIKVELNKKNGKFECSHEFIEVPARKFLTINISILENDDPTEKILKVIKNNKIEDAIIKVNIALTQEKYDNLEQSKIQKALSKAFFVAGVNTEITDILKNQSIVLYKDDVSWQDLLKDYLKQNKISKNRSRELIEAAGELMEESNQDW